MNIELRTATVDDAEKILSIYSPYVKNTAVSFEYDPPSIDEFKERIRKTLEKFPYLVAMHDDEIVGYAYAGGFHTRAAFLHSAELSIYLKQNMRGKGIGRKLYSEIEKMLKDKGFNQGTWEGAEAEYRDSNGKYWCVKTVKKITTKGCPSGYTKDGNTCKKTETLNCTLKQ